MKKHVGRFGLVPALALLAIAAGAVAHADWERSGVLAITKECSQNHGHAGDFCTITSSNLPQIPVGSKVFYDQAAGVPAGLLDSNVVLDAGKGNRAMGRCTLDFATALGLCTFSDGTGDLARFSARVKVDCRSGCRWDGPFHFAGNADNDH